MSDVLALGMDSFDDATEIMQLEDDEGEYNLSPTSEHPHTPHTLNGI